MPLCATARIASRSSSKVAASWLRLAEPDLERRRAGQLGQLAVDVGQAVVLVGVEGRAADVVGGGQAGLGLDRPDHDLVVVLGDQLGLVGVAVRRRRLADHVAQQLVDVGDLLLEQAGLLQEGDHAVAVRGPQRRGPALVLLEQAA